MILASLFLVLSFIITIILISIALTIAMMNRILRLKQRETTISEQMIALDANQLLLHLQAMSIPGIEMDAEVAELKQEVIQAARKHHLHVEN